MVSTLHLSPAPVRAVAIAIGVIAILFLPIAEVMSGFLLGNLHPGLDKPFIFSGRWVLDAACIAAAGLSITAWKIALRRVRFAVLLLIAATALPVLGRAWLIHVDSIVSYPPGYFS